MAGAEDNYSSEELSSDEELQAEFARGTLGSGLIQRAIPPRTYTNNVAGLRESLAAMKASELDWLERMDVTAVTPPTSTTQEDINPEDDFKREMDFYQRALSSVGVGMRKLEELGMSIKRPDDYFAEMVKTDDHMRKVRQNLMVRQKILEKKEKVRKMREQKKYGKKVQHDVLQKRRDEKRVSMDAIKKYRKGKGEKPSFLDNRRGGDDDFPIATTSTKDKKMAPREKSKRRQTRDQKYGFGGKKRHIKSNTADSSADMSTFSSSRDSKYSGRMKAGAGAGAGAGRKGKQPRLGKARRQKMKGKR